MRSLRFTLPGASALLCRAACALLVLSAAACGDGGTGSGNPTPAITHVDPVKVLQYSDSARVTVTGSSFVQGAVVRLNGTPRLTTYVSPTQVTAVVPADLMQQTGSIQVSVLNPEPRGGASGDLALPVEHRVPDVAFMEPAGVEQGSAAFNLNVRGAGYAQGSVVRWNGADRPTTFVSPSHVTAQIPATDVAQVGTAQVTVFNPAPGGGTSVARTFTVAARPNPVAVVTAITPDATVVGTGGTFTLTGTNFMAGSQVRIGGFSPTTTFISATQLQFSLQPNNLPNGGFAQVLVVNPPPGGGLSNSVQLRVDNPAPTLTEVTPAQAVIGLDSLVVRLTGTGFVGSSSVTLDGLPRTIVRFISPTQLETVLASYEIMAPRTFSVRVANPQPGGGTSGALTLTLLNPVPVVTALSPAQASAGQDSLVVRVTGTGFLANTVARFQGAARTTRLVSATALDVVLQPEDLDEAGTFAITVVTPQPGGGTSAAANLTLTLPTPVLTGIPSYGASAGRSGFPLMVHGSGFVNSSVVRWNGVPRETRFVSGTRLEISVTEADVAAPGTAAISVQTPGAGTTDAVQLTIRAPGGVGVSDLQVLDLPAADLVYDAARDRIYASVTAGTYANTVVRINPNTGAVDGSVGVGSGPAKLAISSDGATLWVGLKGASQVRRVALAAFAAGSAFSTGFGEPGELHAMPGHPGTVVVVRGGGAITVYDDGVARPNIGGAPTVTFGESASVMYGFDNYSSEQGLRTFRVDEQGVTETRVGLGLVGGGYTRIHFSAGHVYGSSGDVVDAARGVRVGQFDAGINPSAWAVDTRLGRAFFMHSGEGTLKVFDVNTFQELGSAYVADMNSNHPAAYTERLVQWGTSGLALNDGERIYIFRSPAAGP
jgi:hypothetical protein